MVWKFCEGPKNISQCNYCEKGEAPLKALPIEVLGIGKVQFVLVELAALVNGVCVKQQAPKDQNHKVHDNVHHCCSFPKTLLLPIIAYVNCANG